MTHQVHQYLVKFLNGASAEYNNCHQYQMLQFVSQHKRPNMVNQLIFTQMLFHKYSTSSYVKQENSQSLPKVWIILSVTLELLLNV
jgi:hypothetical protein